MTVATTVTTGGMIVETIEVAMKVGVGSEATEIAIVTATESESAVEVDVATTEIVKRSKKATNMSS